MKEKQFIFNVDLNFTDYIDAKSEKEAIEILKNMYIESYDIDLKDNEWKLIK